MINHVLNLHCFAGVTQSSCLGILATSDSSCQTSYSVSLWGMAVGLQWWDGKAGESQLGYDVLSTCEQPGEKSRACNEDLEQKGWRLTVFFLGLPRMERNKGVDVICPLASGSGLIDESIVGCVLQSLEDRQCVIRILSNSQYIPWNWYYRSIPLILEENFWKLNSPDLVFECGITI